MFEFGWYHIAPWGAELTIYFFLIGVGGMAYVIATAPEVFGAPAAALKPLQVPGLAIAFLVLMICGPLLIMDLGQPARFLYPILHFHWTSPLSWGSLFILAFGVCVVLYAFALLKMKQQPIWLRPVGIIGSLLALAMPLYTGNDLMVQQTREIWASPWIPALFTVLSVSSGAAVMTIVAMLKKEEQAYKSLHHMMGWALGVTLFMFLGMLVMFLYGGEELQQGWRIVTGEFSFNFWVLTFLVGIVAPLALLVLPTTNRQPAMVAVAGLGCLVGAYSFREVILLAGQMPQLFF
jgi:formate-dependent nitrite reductase membrane component NrfD